MAENPQQAALPTCWWHPDRQTGLRCARCERYACPDCLRDASVGFQCIDCVDVGRRQQRAAQVQYRKAGFGHRTVAGARASATAVVAPVLIALNVLVFGVTVAESGSLGSNWLGSDVFNDGVLASPYIAVFDEWWRLIASGFLHFGPLHLAVNMLALWLIGRDLELLLGKVRFLTVYLLALLGGSVAVFALDDLGRFTAGASGAVYGILGGVLVAVVRLKLNLTPVLSIIAINLVISISIPGISLLGHLGGLVVGAASTAAMVYAPEKKRLPVQAGVAVGLLVALVAVVLFRDAQLTELCTTQPGACFS